MKSIIQNSLLALSLVSTSAAFASGKEVKEGKTLNCEMKGGKKKHLKDEAQCTKKGGTWVNVSAPAGDVVKQGSQPSSPVPEAPKPIENSTPAK